MIDKISKYHIDRLERQKGRRTKCLAKIAGYHLGGKRALSGDISNARKLSGECFKYRYRKIDPANGYFTQAATALKNQIKFLNECLRIAIEKDASGELIDFLELEKLENIIEEDLLMKKKVSFDGLSRISSFRGTSFKRKKKLSIFDKMVFGKFSKGYLKAEYLKPDYNELIPHEGK